MQDSKDLVLAENDKENGEKETQEVMLPRESYVQSIYGFFSAKMRQVYINSPINLSTVTGWRYPGIPRLTGNFIIGRLTTVFAQDGLINSLIEAGKLAANHKSGMCYYWMANVCLLLVTKPEHIHQVLVKNNQNIARDSTFGALQRFQGSSLFTDPHDLWAKKRTIYSNWLYKKPSLVSYEPQLKKIIDAYISRIQSSEKSTQDIQVLFTTFALESVVSCLISSDATPEDMVKISDYLAKITDNLINLKTGTKWVLPDILRKFIFGKDEYPDFATFKTEMKKTFKTILLDPIEDTIRNTDNFIHQIWELRSNGKDTLLDSLDIFGDTNVTLFAATDTTASTFQFAIKLLCANPEVEKKLHSELEKHLQNKELTVDDVNKVDYLEMVIKEVMRLYPAGAMFPRDVISPFVLDDLPLSKGDIILYSPYVTHRLSYLWQNPEEFIPERFTKENMEKIPRYAYVPFGAGPHDCIGQRFALQSLKMLLAAIYMRYHVEIENNNFKLNLDNGSLKPRDPVMARFTPIDQSLSYQRKSFGFT